MPPWIRTTDGAITLDLHVQPGARETAPAGLHGGIPKIRVASPPADGKANRELTRFLARAAGVPPSRVTVMSGHASRRKVVRIEGDPASIAPAIARALTT